MNSINIISARVSPPPSRSNSYSSGLGLVGSTKAIPNEDALPEQDEDVTPDEPPRGRKPSVDEKTPLLETLDGSTSYTDPAEISPVKAKGWSYYPKRAATALLNSIRLVFSAIMAPGFYIISLFYDPKGQFAPFYQVKRFGKWVFGGKVGMDPLTEDALKLEHLNEKQAKPSSSRRNTVNEKRRPLLAAPSSASGLSSESESDRRGSPGKHSRRSSTASSRTTRSSKSKPTEEIAPARRSIRIKLHSEESLRHRKKSPGAAHPASQSDGSGGASNSSLEATAAFLKSPTSSAASAAMTRYPRAPAPPRPLIPRRQPSYTIAEPINGRGPQKTLILDLDETLIHSMAKGGRMSSGHMVEVQLPPLPALANPTLGPNLPQTAAQNLQAQHQHPILYYVHKRPHCDDFLRRVCKWYNLVVFTASVQEYADPVIDWLEAERKFFSKRLYRQHCTFRGGAYIKDLSGVEPDLSKVVILDNSPASYAFHIDNAIPIEGWISDPTDNDLMNLIPLLEGLQHVTDVRALLALRGGEDGKHMVA